MKRRLVVVALVVMICGALSVPTVLAAENQASRTLEGQILKDTDAPLPGAVVYLKNTKTMAVRSFISDDRGNYRFTSLSPNVDYEVHAEFKGSKSDTKTLSSFDSRAVARINLKVK